MAGWNDDGQRGEEGNEIETQKGRPSGRQGG